MIDRPRSRLLSLAALLCVLFGLLVGAGTLAPDPAKSPYPDHHDLGGNYGDYQGALVEVSGTVVAVDPVVIESRYDVEALLGVPFDWFALHTAGGSFVAVLVGTVLVPSDHRKRVLLLLAFGAASHHLLDVVLINPSGYSYAVLWPLTGYHPPTARPLPQHRSLAGAGERRTRPPRPAGRHPS